MDIFLIWLYVYVSTKDSAFFSGGTLKTKGSTKDRNKARILTISTCT